jgi:hypothetical protein
MKMDLKMKMSGFVLNTITSQPLFSNTPVLPVASYPGSDNQIIAIQYFHFGLIESFCFNFFNFELIHF